MKVLIAAYPFGTTGRKPLDMLEATGWELIHNPFGRRLKVGEVGDQIHDVDAVIAGTEPYTADTLKDAKNLKIISRVGIGLDSVDLAFCRDNGIQVGYTPDAPSQGVAEMSLANIVNLLRHIHQSDTSVRMGAWNRLMGKLVSDVTVGIIGMGRIGSIVVDLLQPFRPTILAYDIDLQVHGRDLPNVIWLPKNEVLEKSDILSVHIPLTDANRNSIGREEIARMKTGSMLVNTSRGGIVEEDALIDALYQEHLSGAALDVFSNEPYEGKLARMDNVILTAHMGASALGSRYLMELGSSENCIRALRGEALLDDGIKDGLA